MATATDFIADRASQFLATQKAAQAEADATPTTSEAAPVVAPTTSTDDPITQSTDDPAPVEAPLPAVAPQGTEGVDEPIEPQAAPDADEPVVEPPSDELDDETIAAIAELYPDKLLSTEKMKQQIDNAVREQVQRQAEEYQRTQQESAEVATLLQEGEQAVRGMFEMLETAQTELDKAGREEDFESDGILDANAFGQHVQSYGRAVVAEVEGRYNRGIDRVVVDTLKQLPTLSDEQVAAVQTIVNNGTRMRNDPNQSQNAFYYVTSSLFSFLLDRVRDSAQTEERARVQTRPAVVKKIADAVAAKAAAAKLAAQRGKELPTTPPDVKTEATNDEVSEARYDQLVAEGRTAEAQDVVNKMARGVAVSRQV